MDVVWINEETVTAIHSRQIAEHGGSDGIRDLGLLQSALGRPRNLLAYGEDVDLASLAAAYAYGIAKNHPFVDGDKRTAYVVTRTFLVANDADLRASQEEKYITILRLAEGTLGEEGLAAWIRKGIV